MAMLRAFFASSLLLSCQAVMESPQKRVVRSVVSPTGEARPNTKKPVVRSIKAKPVPTNDEDGLAQGTKGQTQDEARSLQGLTAELHSLEHRVEDIEETTHEQNDTRGAKHVAAHAQIPADPKSAGAADSGATSGESGCKVTVYEHWPEGVHIGMASDSKLGKAIKLWNGNYPIGKSVVLEGVGNFPLGALSNRTSSVKVRGDCCKAMGYSDIGCTMNPGSRAIESSTQAEAALPLGVVAPATNIVDYWSCNDCAQCVRVEQVCGVAHTGETASPTEPTQAPTTLSPTNAPTTLAPTQAPTTQSPTNAPTTQAPTPAPTTQSPTNAPTTHAPTPAPTPAPTKPLKLRIWIDYHYHKETSACWEVGNEEYTMKEMTFTVSGESPVSQGCLACTNNGNCNDFGDYQSRTYTWGTSNSKSLSLFWRGWEDDSGNRCTHNSGFWINDDDCHHTQRCSATISRNVNGKADCHGSSHGMTVKWQFTQ